jgi:hypothetical protein
LLGGAPAFTRTRRRRICKPNPAEVAIVFLHGYMLGKANATSFNIPELSQQTDTLVNDCLDSPAAKALDVMMKAKG